MIEDIDEKDLEKALKKAQQLVARVNEMTATMPARDAEPLLRSSHSMVTNIAMALDVLRKRNAADATGEPDPA